LNEKWGFLSRSHVNSVVDLGAAPGGWSQVVAGKMGWVEETVEDDYDYDNVFGGSTASDEPWSKHKKSRKVDEEEELKRPLNTSGKPVYPLADHGTIVAVDRLPMAPITGVRTLQMDFLEPGAFSVIKELLTTPANPDGKADVILSDMSANHTGNRIADIEQSLEICHAVLAFAKRHIRPAEPGRSRGGVLLLKHFAHPDTQLFRQKYLHHKFRDVYYIKPDSSRAESSEGYWLCRGWHGEHSFGLK